MASINELINLSQYQSGDFGREGLNKPPLPYKTPQQQQSESLQLQSLVAELVKKQQEAAILEKQRQLWDSVGKVANNNKTTAGITEQVVDKEEAGGRDIQTVGDYSEEMPNHLDEGNLNGYDGSKGYEAKISSSGKMILAQPGSAKYDRVKVFDRAKKLAQQDLMMKGTSLKEIRASEFAASMKKFIPQAETDLYGKALTPVEQTSFTSEDNRPINPTGVTSSPEDFLPQEKNALKEKRGMIEVARDFYFPKKDKQSLSNEKVMIQTPDGKRGYIPKNNLQKAIQRGAKLVQ